MLTARTKLYVTSRDGTTEMSLGELADAIRGGLDLATVELTLDPEESRHLERKRLAVISVNEMLRNMTHDQAERTVKLLHSCDLLMNLADVHT